MRPYLALLLCMGRLRDVGTAPTNVTTGGDLHSAFADANVTDITVHGPLLLDPFVYCRETTTLTSRRVSITPATPALFWDMYGTSATRLTSLQLDGPCIRLSSSSLVIRNGFQFVSDVVVSRVDDLVHSFLAVFDVDAESDVEIESVSFQIAPTSNLTGLQQDVLDRGGTAFIAAGVITVASVNVEPWHLTNVRITVAQSVTVSDSQVLQKVLSAGTVPYIVLTRDVTIAEWRNTTYVGTYVVITSSRQVVFDTAFKTATVTTVRGGAVHIQGDIAFTNSMAQNDRLGEEGLLPFVSLNTGASIVDATQTGGVLTIEDASVYGDHLSVLWSPNFDRAYPSCVQGFVVSYNSTPDSIDVSTLYLSATTYFVCVSNVSYGSESYRLLSNVRLPYGRGPQDADQLRKFIPLIVVLGAVLIFFAAALAALVALKCCRKTTCKDELGLGATMREMAIATLGDVCLHELLGWGRYGRVYRATWAGREVAIKVGHPVRLTEDRDPLQDAKLTESLQHVNVVKALKSIYRDIEAATGTPEVILVEPWFVMEYCDMGSLATAIKRNVFFQKNTNPTLNTILQTARDVTTGMAFLHDKGVLHGDLTCSNVLLVQDALDPRGFHVKVGDFGQAQTFSRWSKVTMDADVHGNVSHQPPEMLVNGTLSPAADVWAFGMVLYELYTGKAPFQEYSDAQMLYVISTIQHLPPIPAHCPPDVRDVMEQCWKKKEERPSFVQLTHVITAILRKYT